MLVTGGMSLNILQVNGGLTLTSDLLVTEGMLTVQSGLLVSGVLSSFMIYRC